MTEWTGTTIMKHNNFGYLMGEGARAIFKHGFMSFAAICITVACLVIINSFALITYDLNLTVEDIQKQMRIVVCVDETYTEAEAKSVGSDINMLANVQNGKIHQNQFHGILFHTWNASFLCYPKSIDF